MPVPARRSYTRTWLLLTTFISNSSTSSTTTPTTPTTTRRTMDGVEHDKEILQWDENDVQAWLKSIGFPQYEQQIRGSRRLLNGPQAPADRSTENNITGDVLVMLNAESLKEFGVATIGQRVAILKAVYQLKIAQNVPIEPDDYVPQCKTPLQLLQRDLPSFRGLGCGDI